LTTEMARAISSFVLALSAPSPIVLALDIDPYASKTAGMWARSARVASWSSVSVSLAFPIWFTPRVGRLTLHPVAATSSPDGALPRMTTLDWTESDEAVDWGELSELYRLAPLGEKPPAALRTVFGNSMFKCFVYSDGRLIG